MFIFANNMQQSLTVRSESFNSDREASGVRCRGRARGVGLEPGPGRSTARARGPSAVPTHGARPGETGETETETLTGATHGRIFCWPAHFSCSQPARRDRTIVSVASQATRHHLLQNCNSATFGYSPDNDLVLAKYLTSPVTEPRSPVCKIQREIFKTE